MKDGAGVGAFVFIPPGFSELGRLPLFVPRPRLVSSLYSSTFDEAGEKKASLASVFLVCFGPARDAQAMYSSKWGYLTSVR